MAKTIDMADWEQDFSPTLDRIEAQNNADFQEQYVRVREDDEKKQKKVKKKNKK